MNPLPTITIEKGIPVPSSERSARWTEFFSTIQVGESFTIQEERERRRILENATRHEVWFTSMRQRDGTYRLWRVATKEERLRNPTRKAPY